MFEKYSRLKRNFKGHSFWARGYYGIIAISSRKIILKTIFSKPAPKSKDNKDKNLVFPRASIADGHLCVNALADTACCKVYHPTLNRIRPESTRDRKIPNRRLCRWKIWRLSAQPDCWFGHVSRPLLDPIINCRQSFRRYAPYPMCFQPATRNSSLVTRHS